jgi:hypothetical protein
MLFALLFVFLKSQEGWSWIGEGREDLGEVVKGKSHDQKTLCEKIILHLKLVIKLVYLCFLI